METLNTPSALYRMVWRWHFYAGLVCLPFLFTMAVTGALYLYRAELSDWLYHDRLFVPRAGPSHRSPSEIVDAARSHVRGTAVRYVAAADESRTAEVGVRPPTGSPISVFVDPTTGRVLGTIADDSKAMEVVKGLHSLAIAGPVANHWIEVVAGWCIVLIVSGTYLWWPRGSPGGVVTIRQSPRARVWWRDLHAITGAFAGSVVLFLAVTGMPWSAFWGHQFADAMRRLDLGLPAYVWGARPHSDVEMASHGAVPWPLEHEHVPISESPHDPKPIGLDAAIAIYADMGLRTGYTVALPDGPQGVYSAMHFPDDATLERVVHLDQYSGRPIVDVGFRDYGAVAKVTEWGISVHQGKQYGAANRWLILGGCVAIVVLTVTSFVMWWKRRPRGRVAAPPRARSESAARGAAAIAVALGLVFPLLGASMLVALAIDFLVPERWKTRYSL